MNLSSQKVISTKKGKRTRIKRAERAKKMMIKILKLVKVNKRKISKLKKKCLVLNHQEFWQNSQIQLME